MSLESYSRRAPHPIARTGSEDLRLIQQPWETHQQNCISHGVDVALVSLYGETALHTAASLGHIQSPRALLESGAYPNATISEGHNPLTKLAYMITRCSLIC